MERLVALKGRPSLSRIHPGSTALPLPWRSTHPAISRMPAGWWVLLVAYAAGTWGCASAPVVGTPLRSPPGSATAMVPGPVRTVVIDAGNGGDDPGTSHFGLKEKHLALDIVRRLRGCLQDAGLTVVMTRETDRFIPLSGRPAVANRLQADLFLSVHINANRNRRVSGIEVYYPRTSEVSADAQWPPAVSPEEIGTPSTTVKQVLWDLVLRRTRFQSRHLAASICRAMRQGLQAPCRGTKPARFVVLREAWMPAVLVEVGYVTNQQEASRLRDAAYRQAAAQAIAEGIVAYVRDVGAQHI
ncbi:MAG: N-acetylmuramoyl-L-alanine amidase [Candidatus Omnitrophica bacterium]|nr:N-acetylmuramoyl-L-alanine amidase [Candidatus Omnitrophota bacterium]